MNRPPGGWSGVQENVGVGGDEGMKNRELGEFGEVEMAN